VVKGIIFSLAISWAGLAFGEEEVPDFSRLGATAFNERKEAMGSLEEWVLADQTKAKDVILKKYLRCANPEVRARLLHLLERAYFPAKGFVGITMRSTLWDQVGRFHEEKMAFGVRVTHVGKETPAALSGLKPDDILLKINGWEVKGEDDITAKVANQIQKNPPATPVSLEVMRGDKTVKVTLKLTILPVPTERAKSLLATTKSNKDVLPADLQREITEFESWLTEEIRKDRKNLIADRR